ncbi:hypothetical protein [Planktothrix phage Pra-JY27]|nr:hypothetical protein [Planktothrix phage Pag-Yong1]WEV89244.1 hypothetical protein [Synechococcus phage MinM2]
MSEATYYVVKAESGFYELRQTRYIGKRHPHDRCGVARTIEQMREIASLLKGSVDWSRVESAEGDGACTST